MPHKMYISHHYNNPHNSNTFATKKILVPEILGKNQHKKILLHTQKMMVSVSTPKKRT